MKDKVSPDNQSIAEENNAPRKVAPPRTPVGRATVTKDYNPKMVSAFRTDTSVAVTRDDKRYLEDLCELKGDKSIKDTLAGIIATHRNGVSA